MEELEIAWSTGEAAPDNIKEDCCPGAPFITFRAPPPSVSLALINPQALSGHITQWVNVRTTDTVAKLASALVRADRNIKGKVTVDK